MSCLYCKNMLLLGSEWHHYGRLSQLRCWRSLWTCKLCLCLEFNEIVWAKRSSVWAMWEPWWLDTLSSVKHMRPEEHLWLSWVSGWPRTLAQGEVRVTPQSLWGCMAYQFLQWENMTYGSEALAYIWTIEHNSILVSTSSIHEEQYSWSVGICVWAVHHYSISRDSRTSMTVSIRRSEVSMKHVYSLWALVTRMSVSTSRSDESISNWSTTLQACWLHQTSWLATLTLHWTYSPSPLRLNIVTTENRKHVSTQS